MVLYHLNIKQPQPRVSPVILNTYSEASRFVLGAPRLIYQPLRLTVTFLTGNGKIAYWNFRKMGGSQSINKQPSPLSRKPHTMAITCLDISRDGTMAVTGNEQLSISGVGVDRGVIELRGLCLRELGQLQYFAVPLLQKCHIRDENITSCSTV